MKKTGYSKVLISLRSGKRSVFLFVLFLFLFPVSVFAADWSEVISAYLSVPINYPDSSAWIEKSPTGYNIWKRPTASVWKSQINYQYDFAYASIINKDGYYDAGCSCNYEVWTYRVEQYLTPVVTDITCFNQELNTQQGIQEMRVFNVTCTFQYGDWAANAACIDQKKQELPPPVDGSVFNCESYDVLVNSIDEPISNCESRTLTMSVGGMIDTDPLISNSCQCTPEGTKFSEKTESGKCRYKNIVGDPTDPNTNITITAPGFTVMDSSDPVRTETTNPDGTVTVTDTVTNTYPDSTQSQDSTSVTTYPDSSTSTNITTGANIIGGVAIGGTNTTTLTSGSNILTTTTLPSNLVTTISTVGGLKTKTLLKKMVGVGGGGDIWADPPATVIVPSIPSASSHTSEYPTTLDTVPENDIKTLIGDFIATSPLVSAVQNSRIETIDLECSFTSPDVFGSPVTLDFCSLESMISVFGVLFVIVCTFRSFFILFGID